MTTDNVYSDAEKPAFGRVREWVELATVRAIARCERCGVSNARQSDVLHHWRGFYTAERWPNDGLTSESTIRCSAPECRPVVRDDAGAPRVLATGDCQDEGGPRRVLAADAPSVGGAGDARPDSVGPDGVAATDEGPCGSIRAVEEQLLALKGPCGSPRCSRCSIRAVEERLLALTRTVGDVPTAGRRPYPGEVRALVAAIRAHRSPLPTPIETRDALNRIRAARDYVDSVADSVAFGDDEQTALRAVADGLDAIVARLLRSERVA